MDINTILHILGPWAPVADVGAGAYLILNDLEDVLIYRKSSGRWNFSSIVRALTNDVVNQSALAGFGAAFMGTLATGHDFRTAVGAGVVAIGVMNVGNLERTTVGKFKLLFGLAGANVPIPPTPPTPASDTAKS